MRRLRQATNWQTEIDGVLETLGRALNCHRSILFRMRDLPDKGFAQSIAGHWLDDSVVESGRPPTIIVQSMVDTDPLLERLRERCRNRVVRLDNGVDAEASAAFDRSIKKGPDFKAEGVGPLFFELEIE